MRNLICKLELLITLTYILLSPTGIYAQNERIIKDSKEVITSRKCGAKTTFQITMSPLFLQINGNSDWMYPSYHKSNKSVYHDSWGREISLCLPKGVRRLYSGYELVVQYNSGAVVWLGIDAYTRTQNLTPSCIDINPTSININAKYKDGIYSPSCSFIDTLADVTRIRLASNWPYSKFQIIDVFIRNKWYNTESSYIAFKNNKVVDKDGYKLEPILSCLAPAKKGMKSIMSVKDGIFILAYNIPERDYPIFDACIRNTFCIKNRLMEFIDISDDDRLSKEALEDGWRNLTKRFYLYYRLYKELPTITPPDTAEYKRLIFGDITTEPDTFLLIRHKSRCSE